MITFDITWYHFISVNFSWFRFIRIISLKFTKIYLISLDSLDFTTFHLVSLNFIDFINDWVSEFYTGPAVANLSHWRSDRLPGILRDEYTVSCRYNYFDVVCKWPKFCDELITGVNAKIFHFQLRKMYLFVTLFTG